jgi:hypothetical protein
VHPTRQGSTERCRATHSSPRDRHDRAGRRKTRTKMPTTSVTQPESAQSEHRLRLLEAELARSSRPRLSLAAEESGV